MFTLLIKLSRYIIVNMNNSSYFLVLKGLVPFSLVFISGLKHKYKHVLARYDSLRFCRVKAKGNLLSLAN